MPIVGFIVLGDRTSHGGVVISADPTWTIDGQPVARVGDKVTCPRCKRISTIATSRFPTVIDLGKPMAYDQDMTDCGAVIYSRHNDHAGWGEADDDAPDEQAVTHAGEARVAPVAESIPRKAPRFQEHFILRNNETGELLAGIPYTIRTGDGKTFEGETDANGRTDVVWSDSPLPVEVIAHPKPAADADPYHYAGERYDGL